MIDFEKLKEAHKLCHKSGYWLDYNVEGDEVSQIGIWKCTDAGGDIECILGLNYVITKLKDLKLKELTQTEPKYKAGDKVWRLDDEDWPTSLLICEIDTSSDEMYLDIDGDWWMECQLYPTRESLIDAQINHWMKLKESTLPPCEDQPGRIEAENKYFNDIKSSCCSVHTGTTEECREECEHEPSGRMRNIYSDAMEVNESTYECKKCVKFYR